MTSQSSLGFRPTATVDAQTAVRHARFETLDGMRGVAALIVAASHFGTKNVQLAPEGYLAVDFFFMLSGFVIALNYNEKMARGMSVASFACQRAMRLYPLYLLGLSIGLTKFVAELLAKTPHAEKLWELICNFSFGLFVLPTPVSSDLFPLNNPAWSLFFEAIVNALYATILFRIGRTSLIAVAFLSGLFLLLIVKQPLYFNLGWEWGNFLGGGLRTLFGFTVGMLLYTFHCHSKRATSYAALFAIATLAIVLLLRTSHKAVLEPFAVLCVFPLITYAGTRFEAPNFARSLCTLLGEISYPIYILHFPLLALFTSGFQSRLNLSVSYGAFFIFLIVLGLVASRLFDAPARAGMKRVMVRKGLL